MNFLLVGLFGIHLKLSFGHMLTFIYFAKKTGSFGFK